MAVGCGVAPGLGAGAAWGRNLHTTCGKLCGEGRAHRRAEGGCAVPANHWPSHKTPSKQDVVTGQRSLRGLRGLDTACAVRCAESGPDRPSSRWRAGSAPAEADFHRRERIEGAGSAGAGSAGVLATRGPGVHTKVDEGSSVGSERI